MPVESWIAPDEAPALAAAASEMIDAVLATRGVLAQEVFWSTIRKAYNTPYNAPAPRKHPQPPVSAKRPEPVTVVLDDMPPLPVAAMAASLAMSVQPGALDVQAA